MVVIVLGVILPCAELLSYWFFSCFFFTSNVALIHPALFISHVNDIELILGVFFPLMWGANA
jgi:hypothetical protein